MTGRLFLALSCALVLYACGVKNDLEIPNAQLPQDSTADEANDPSRPPQPLGL